MKATGKLVGARAVRERETLETMVRLFCRHQHHRGDLCPECQQLLDYSTELIESCDWGNDKPVCDNCSFECFLPSPREKIRTVIDATRNRMLWEHPQMILRHWLDSFHQVSDTGFRRSNYGSWGSE